MKTNECSRDLPPYANLTDTTAARHLLSLAQESRDRAGVGDSGFHLRQIAAVHGRGPGGEEIAWQVARQGMGLPNTSLYIANCRAAAAGLRMTDEGNMSHNNLVTGPPYPRISSYTKNRPVALAAALRDSSRPLGTAITIEAHSASMEKAGMVWTADLNLSFLAALLMVRPDSSGIRDVVVMPEGKKVNFLSAEVPEGVCVIDYGTGDGLVTRPGDARREYVDITQGWGLRELEGAVDLLGSLDVYLYLGARTLSTCLEADLPPNLPTFTPIDYKAARTLDLPRAACALNWDGNNMSPQSFREFAIPVVTAPRFLT